jgi:hypothetical protein
LYCPSLTKRARSTRILRYVPLQLHTPGTG